MLGHRFWPAIFARSISAILSSLGTRVAEQEHSNLRTECSAAWKRVCLHRLVDTVRRAGRVAAAESANLLEAQTSQCWEALEGQ